MAAAGFRTFYAHALRSVRGLVAWQEWFLTVDPGSGGQPMMTPGFSSQHYVQDIGGWSLAGDAFVAW